MEYELVKDALYGVITISFVIINGKYREILFLIMTIFFEFRMSFYV